jgi:putative N-acetyltransferase (TIGR04045 family)
MSALHCREIADAAERDICYAIRRQVFVEEQKLFDCDDRDEHDEYAIHYAALQHNEIIGTVRIYRDPEGIWWGGRLAVLKRYRGRAGRLLIQACVERVRSEGAAHFRAFIQQENIAFFKTLNWVEVGAPTLMCNRPHQLMEAVL